MKKLGKLPRKFNPHIMHLSAIMADRNLPTPPAQVDWTNGVNEFGMMLNDTLSDCSCAGIYHAIQIWTMNLTQEKTEQDNIVLSLYENACGYNPNIPSTDAGAILQDVLLYCTNTGIPLDDDVEKLVGFIEVDPRNIEDVKIAVNDFGLAYIGFDVPLSIYDNNEPKKFWDVEGNSDIEGGHCVIIVAYDEVGPTVISWGELYKMSWSFFQQYTDEVYALLSRDWLNSANQMPLGLSIDELESLMSAIKKL